MPESANGPILSKGDKASTGPLYVVIATITVAAMVASFILGHVSPAARKQSPDDG